MSLDPTVANGLFALGGALLGAIPAITVAWLKERSDARRHLRDQALQVALEAWRLRLMHTPQVQPLEHQVIYSNLLCQLAAEDGLTKDRIARRLDEISTIVDLMAEHSRKRAATD